MSIEAADAPRSLAPVLAAIGALAALDIFGAALARAWSEHRSALAMVGGVVVSGLLFVVYGKSLDYAELSTVTIGWVAMLQVGVVVLERLHGVVLPPGRLAAIGGIVALQAYITLSDVGTTAVG